MLSDDITGTVGKTASMTGSVLGGLFRGAILGALLATAAVFVIGAMPLVAAVTGASSLAAAGSAAAAAAAAGAAHVGAVGVASAILGAKIGGMLLGATSIIPSASEGFGLKRLFAGNARRTQVTESSEPSVVVHQPLSVTVPKRDVTVENYAYEPGRGAQMLQKGSEQTSTICRST